MVWEIKCWSNWVLGVGGQASPAKKKASRADVPVVSESKRPMLKLTASLVGTLNSGLFFFAFSTINWPVLETIHWPKRRNRKIENRK